MSFLDSLEEDKVYLGVDVGSVSTRVVALGRQPTYTFLHSIEKQSSRFSLVLAPDTGDNDRIYMLISDYTRIQGEPIRATFQLLAELTRHFTPQLLGGLRLTGGVGARHIAHMLNAPLENEFRALAVAIGTFYPQVATILEMGGESSKYLSITVVPESGDITILDYGKNGDCAAGTGVFMDQQATRLLYEIDEVGDLVVQTNASAIIAGRCSVFAKSDMIHAQQKGYQPPEILKGLCEAVIRNFKGTIIKGKRLQKKIAFIGGVAANKGAVQALLDIFDLKDGELLVPPQYAWVGAIGAALLASDPRSDKEIPKIFPLPAVPRSKITTFPRTKPLSTRKVVLLRDVTQKFTFTDKKLPVPAYLGIDIGSVSTKLVVIDKEGVLIKEIYTRTDARPIEVVTWGLQEIDREIGNKIEILGVGTTGSGRELIGLLVGADTIKDEITAHKTGAMHIGERLLHKKVDTIFDIGGQDAKYIAIENGVVVDFTMNEACAAGTGSFLEEQSERLDIPIVKKFSDLAFQSREPIRLGERCTVFMEKVLSPYLQQGASKIDLVAGLAYSIVLNYLNRVVRGRRIGEVVFFQGGTAYNDAVAAAFATTLDQEIIVPPYNGVLGAVGAAIIAKEKIETSHTKTRFRGFNVQTLNYSLRNFTCKGCANFCEIQEFTVENEKSYWGDKCSDRYRKARKSIRKPDIENLIHFRETLYEPFLEQSGTGMTCGMPRSMYFYERLPFWGTYLRELGFRLVFSDKTNKAIVNKGVAATVAEPCFPIIVAHGHIQSLIEQKVDFIFQPNVINLEAQHPEVESFLCPWGQTQSFVFKHAPAFKDYWQKFLTPTIRFRQGKGAVKAVLRATFKKFGIKDADSNRAVDKAYKAQSEFEQCLIQRGQQALDLLQHRDAKAIVLVGRPYNIYDHSVSLNIPAKLRDYYGINVIPFEFLPLKGIDISDINDSMFWSFGYKILQASKLIATRENLHLIYITNFKCGPDSYIKHYVHDASNKPYLVLQFDGHSNDAGIITRCEAYLDSKGFL